MGRLASLIGFALAAATFAGAPATAQAPTMRAEFVVSQDGNRDVIVDGRVWTCSGNVCTARGDDARPAIACRKLARKLGPISRFATAQTELDADGLAICNQDHR